MFKYLTAYTSKGQLEEADLTSFLNNGTALAIFQSLGTQPRLTEA